MNAVVVGFDGSATARGALRFAADEAMRRKLPVRVVTAVEPMPPHWEEPSAADMLGVGERLIRAMLPADRVQCLAPFGPAADVLCEQSAEADLLVVGRGRRRRISLLGSVAAHVASSANCPVAVVGDSDVPHMPHTGPVVVGVDVDDVAEEALAEAFAEAAVRGRDLVAVYARGSARSVLPGAELPLGLRGREDEVEAAARLTEAIAPWQRKYPAVAVTAIGRRAGAVSLLLEAGSAASMVVVGTHDRGPMARFLLGSVGQSVLRRAACPVLVARPHRRATAQEMAPRPSAESAP
ncbi:MAG: universal stress protein [Sporichthyaceae bacterium]